MDESKEKGEEKKRRAPRQKERKKRLTDWKHSSQKKKLKGEKSSKTRENNVVVVFRSFLDSIQSVSQSVCPLLLLQSQGKKCSSSQTQMMGGKNDKRGEIKNKYTDYVRNNLTFLPPFTLFSLISNVSLMHMHLKASKFYSISTLQFSSRRNSQRGNCSNGKSGPRATIVNVPSSATSSIGTMQVVVLNQNSST